MKSGIVGLLAVGSVCGALAGSAVTAQERTLHDGVYTKEQAARGAKTYGQRCAGCHRADEFSGERIKPWKGQPALNLFNVIRLTMPEEAPGSLSRQEYADILTYIFEQNGGKPGSTELTATDEMLRSVLMVGSAK
ncbi:MAG: cytochrome c [Acidobacteria bacterium]|nr:cytochrome c [Acidobacteriota bacterium]